MCWAAQRGRGTPRRCVSCAARPPPRLPGVVVLTDPDVAGRQARNALDDALGALARLCAGAAGDGGWGKRHHVRGM